VNEAIASKAFEAALRGHRPVFGEFFLARLLGLQIDYQGPHCTVTFESRDFMFNPQGTLHGGVIATVLDISMGHLLNHVQGPGATLEMKIQYVKAAREGTLRCRGEFIQQGRGISFLQSTLVDEADAVIAFATATWKRVNGQPASKALAAGADVIPTTTGEFQ
jgi:uncharacterized protein (TIGR00369 family)